MSARKNTRDIAFHPSQYRLKAERMVGLIANEEVRVKLESGMLGLYVKALLWCNQEFCKMDDTWISVREINPAAKRIAK